MDSSLIILVIQFSVSWSLCWAAQVAFYEGRCRFGDRRNCRASLQIIRDKSDTCCIVRGMVGDCNRWAEDLMTQFITTQVIWVTYLSQKTGFVWHFFFLSRITFFDYQICPPKKNIAFWQWNRCLDENQRNTGCTRLYASIYQGLFIYMNLHMYIICSHACWLSLRPSIAEYPPGNSTQRADKLSIWCYLMIPNATCGLYICIWNSVHVCYIHMITYALICIIYIFICISSYISTGKNVWAGCI